eukprot:203390-Chlamydomonas_euryale.AAC.1
MPYAGAGLRRNEGSGFGWLAGGGVDVLGVGVWSFHPATLVCTPHASPTTSITHNERMTIPHTSADPPLCAPSNPLLPHVPHTPPHTCATLTYAGPRRSMHSRSCRARAASRALPPPPPTVPPASLS